MLDELTRIPPFLASEVSENSIAPRCDFCKEIACETDAMACGECSGQSCSGQCAASECGQCGSCQTGGCQSGCQGCQTACESSAQYPTGYGSITIIDTTKNTISFRLSAISRATSYLVFYRRTVDAVAVRFETWDLENTLENLQADTEYTINYVGKNSYGTGPLMPEGKTATTNSARPTNWEWWSDVRAGQPVAFTVAEFQAFYDKIDEFRAYKYGTAADWPNFKLVSKGTPLSAAIVNECRAAIAPITAATMPPTAYPGDPVSADYFNKLKDYLNSVT